MSAILARKPLTYVRTYTFGSIGFFFTLDARAVFSLFQGAGGLQLIVNLSNRETKTRMIKV